MQILDFELEKPDLLRWQKYQNDLYGRRERRAKTWRTDLLVALLTLVVLFPAIVLITTYRGPNFWLALYVVIAPICAVVFIAMYMQRREARRITSQIGAITCSFGDDGLLMQKRGPYTTYIPRSAIKEHKLNSDDLLILLQNEDLLMIPVRAIPNPELVVSWLNLRAP